MNGRTHVDLFSGLGGFSLAAAANGVRTVQFCEFDQRCRDFLARAFPGVPIHDDVRTLSAQDPEGTWLLSAGVPCQSASRAGKQRGAEDSRWLWPEALRLLRHYQPTWALFENPPGIGDVGLAGILAAVEAEGYEVRVHSIPACAVGAPHRRERYWIVAHTSPAGREGTDAEPRADGLCAEHRESLDHTPEARHDRQERRAESDSRDEARMCLPCSRHEGAWADYVWLPCADGKVRRAPGDSFSLVDGLHRSVLGALGNSIVPQVAQALIAAMIQAEEAA